MDVRNYDTDTSQTCLVETVTRNARTVEVVVRTPKGKGTIRITCPKCRETFVRKS